MATILGVCSLRACGLQKLRCTVWDYVGRRLVLEFNPQDIKDRQHTERELGVAASQLPEFSTPPTQLGLRERCVCQRRRAIASTGIMTCPTMCAFGVAVRSPRSFSATSLDISAAVEDANASSAFKCGVAKTVRFYDAVRCTCCRGLWLIAPTCATLDAE